MISSAEYKYSRNICWKVTGWVSTSLQLPLMSLSQVLELLRGSRRLLRRGAWLDYLIEHPSRLKRKRGMRILLLLLGWHIIMFPLKALWVSYGKRVWLSLLVVVLGHLLLLYIQSVPMDVQQHSKWKSRLLCIHFFFFCSGGWKMESLHSPKKLIRL